MNVIEFEKRLTARDASRPRRWPNPLVDVPVLPALLLLGGAFGSAFSLDWPGTTDRLTTAAVSRQFSLCGLRPDRNCVVDGDTFYLNGQAIRIVDIDAPEMHPSRCSHEAQLGERATRRLHELLNAGPFQLGRGWFDRDEDIYGRKLRRATRGGKSVGSMLVDEGLARRGAGRRQPWCA